MLELTEEELDALVEEATVDAYNEEEQLGGFAVMIEDNLEMPFETTVLGVMVTVKGVTQTESGIVADCVRDGQRRDPPWLRRGRRAAVRAGGEAGALGARATGQAPVEAGSRPLP